MIEAKNLSKRYGESLAVDDLSFRVEAGKVTGFLGPNGAGKSTTMRMLVGLDQPTSGSVTIDGIAFGRLGRPLFEVGALLDAQAVHGGRSAFNHLLALAQSNGIARDRVHEVLDTVGLADVASRRVGKFSLGMSQRLGIAAALLGDPRILLLDEPTNGLDPEGIHWMRNFMKRWAAEGRAVFVSSHLMAEIALTADHLIVIGRGRLVADASVDEVIARSSKQSVLVRSPDAERLASLVATRGGQVTVAEDGRLVVTGLAAAEVGEMAAADRLVLHELVPHRASLEEAFMELTRGSVDFHAGEGDVAEKVEAHA